MSYLRALLRPRTLLIIAVGLLAAIQLVPVWAYQTNPPVQAEPAWTNPQAREVARKACFDCHSNQTVWPLYTKIAPASWLITYDVLKGREELNFSEWQALGAEVGEMGDEIAEVIQEGEMPPNQYLIMHPEAKLNPAEQQLLIDSFRSAATR
jgi:Haem-binding domain